MANGAACLLNSAGVISVNGTLTGLGRLYAATMEN